MLWTFLHLQRSATSSYVSKRRVQGGGTGFAERPETWDGTTVCVCGGEGIKDDSEESEQLGVRRTENS